MSDLQVGQVLSLRVRFNNENEILKDRHPCLIAKIYEELEAIEIIQLTSFKGKEYKAYNKYYKLIVCDNPQETVIDKDSLAQLDNRFTVDLFDGLLNYRRQKDKLSDEKLQDVLKAYEKYHLENIIDENKIVHMEEDEIRKLND